MKSNKNLVLLGMMSSGKSTIGRLLAHKLSLKFFDIDTVIENKTKMEISEIFEKKGEILFRDLEEKITLQFLNKINCIISLGGGGFINKVIREKIQKKAIPIWLDWNPKTLISRIRKNNKRPVTLNLNDNELNDLIISRSKIYSKSKYKINCENMTRTEIIKKIIQIYETI